MNWQNVECVTFYRWTATHNLQIPDKCSVNTYGFVFNSDCQDNVSQNEPIAVKWIDKKQMTDAWGIETDITNTMDSLRTTT